MENGILHFRRQMGISQIEAANMLEIPVSSLCKYETGENQCPVTAYEKMSNLYQVTIDELLQEYPNIWKPNNNKNNSMAELTIFFGAQFVTNVFFEWNGE